MVQWDTLWLNGHICVVVSDPQRDPGGVFVAALTTYEWYKDDACLLNKGDHRALRHLTCVAYDFFDDLFPAGYLNSLEIDQPVPHLARRILDGARATRRISNEAWCLLNRQGLV